MICPYCGNITTWYVGIDDGLGDYGDCIGDVWHCADCDLDFEGYLIPYSELDDDAERAAYVECRVQEHEAFGITDYRVGDFYEEYDTGNTRDGELPDKHEVAYVCPACEGTGWFELGHGLDPIPCPVCRSEEENNGEG